jgi:import inner membrane translocase subunit TIM13
MSDPQQLAQQMRALSEAKFIQQMISTLSDRCFDKCVHKPRYTLDSAERACISSCFDSFTQSFQSVAQVYQGFMSRSVQED